MWEGFKYWCKNHDFQWKYKLTVCLPLFVVLVAIDWGTKIGIQLHYEQGASATWIDNFLGFNYTVNLGAAGNILSTNLAAVVSGEAIITVIALIAFIFLDDKMWLIVVVFIFSGAFANLIARIWAPAFAAESIPWDHKDDETWKALIGKKGGVIDFLDTNLFGWKFINNLADIWVSIEIILIVVFVIVELIKWINEEKNHKTELINNDLEPSEESVKVIKAKQPEPKTYTDKELKAQEKLEKKMKKYERKNK